VKTQRLMRTWYPTDGFVDDAEYIGTFSAEFPSEDQSRRIVAVKWLENRPEVEVTWLVRGET